jgi:hypothetical protein
LGLANEATKHFDDSLNTHISPFYQVKEKGVPLLPYNNLGRNRPLKDLIACLGALSQNTQRMNSILQTTNA